MTVSLLFGWAFFKDPQCWHTLYEFCNISIRSEKWRDIRYILRWWCILIASHIFLDWAWYCWQILHDLKLSSWLCQILICFGCKVFCMASFENFMESVDKLCHHGGMYSNIVNWYLHSIYSEENLFHHLLESFTYITKIEESALKSMATSRHYEYNVPRFLSQWKLKETTWSIGFAKYFKPCIACKVSSTLRSI